MVGDGRTDRHEVAEVRAEVEEAGEFLKRTAVLVGDPASDVEVGAVTERDLSLDLEIHQGVGHVEATEDVAAANAGDGLDSNRNVGFDFCSAERRGEKKGEDGGSAHG